MGKEIKYFKKIYSDRVACGKWETGNAINYNDGEDYTVEFIEKAEYESIVNVPIPESVLALEQLKDTDSDAIRIIDDIVNYIVDGTPLPKSAKDKINNRKSLREKL